MIELAWFAAGVVATTIALALRRLSRPARAQATPDADARREPAAHESAPEPPPAEVQLVPGPIAVGARRLARTVGEELANLVSGVEGRAHHLIQCAPDRRELPRAAESLLHAVHRLRTPRTRLAASSEGRAATAGTTDAAAVVASPGDELQQMQLGLELRWDPPDALPRVPVAPDIVRDALLFLCSALLRAERGATHLSITSELCFASERPHVQIELALEWTTESSPSTHALFEEPGFTLDLESANKLITGHGGEVALSHLPGRTVRAVVRWPAVTSEAISVGGDDADRARDEAGHLYGSALLLEADPAIRAMLANELKATGRAVFACADIASARTFLEATPDRFELLIVDHPQRLDADEALLPLIRDVVPDLKICVLGQGESATHRDWPQVHRIQKPFGVHELRRALASVLAGG